MISYSALTGITQATISRLEALQVNLSFESMIRLILALGIGLSAQLPFDRDVTLISKAVLPSGLEDIPQ